jgi:uncharacterized membrane protein
MEIEHWKCITFLVSAAIAKFGANLLGQVMASDVAKWVESGGTVLSVGILLLMLRYMREKLESKDKRLDDLMDRNMAIHEKATEARMKLDSTLDKQADALEKLKEVIDRKIK